jgi:hypothetical protein
MDEKSCKDYKDWNIWKTQLCRFCIARNCQGREYSYDLAGPREKSRRVPVKTRIINGQYVWDWYGVDY